MSAKPVHLSVFGLVGAVVVGLIFAGGVNWFGLAWFEPGEAGRDGFLAGTIAGVVSGLASVLPLLVGARFGMMGVVGGYFAGSFTRAILGIGIGLGLVSLWHVSSVVTLLTMAVYYLAVLTAESIVVGRVLWTLPCDANETIET